MQVYKYASMHVCKYATMQVCNYASMQVCQYVSIRQVGKYASLGKNTRKVFLSDLEAFKGIYLLFVGNSRSSSLKLEFEILTL